MRIAQSDTGLSLAHPLALPIAQYPHQPADQMHTLSISSASLRCVTLSLLIVKSACNSGICTKHQVATKSRLHSVYRTYQESYEDHYCWGRYYYHDTCTKYRTNGAFVDEEEYYTELETKEFCCPGYADTNLPDCTSCAPRCEPVCDLTCLNGKCTRPNYCDCDTGYSKRNGTEHICEPVCSEPCVHGYCSQPETCLCDPGYENHSSHRYTCVPVCSPPCVHANCTAPDVCTCFPGYKKITDDPQKCHAYCSEPCRNAVCTKPDVCSCFLGYEKYNYHSNVCNPVCSKHCVNGTCTGPDTCTCNNGFRLVGTYYNCEPICSGCLNSFCSAPEVCTCFLGYEVDVNGNFDCLPVCSPKCFNSNCTAPNSCECFSGFEITDNPAVCKPYCSDGCENGVCTEPELCTCLWGFHSEDNTHNCSVLSDESHECTFVNQLVEHHFDRSCFNISGDLHLTELKDCKILQELLKHIKQQTSAAFIKLNCGEVSYLRAFDNYLSLNLFCDITWNDEKQDSQSSDVEIYSTDELYTTLPYTTETELTDQSTTDDGYSTSELSLSSSNHFITEDPLEEGIVNGSLDNFPNPGENTGIENPTQQSIIDLPKQDKFNMIFDKSAKDSIEAHLDFPLRLNITVQFLSMIRSKQLTQGYFDNSSDSLDQDWCLCHKTKTWRLCANAQIQFFLCPCKSTYIGAQMADSSSPLLILKMASISVMTVFLMIMVVLYVYTKLKQVGTYSTSSRKEIAALSTPPTLRLESFSSSTEDINTTAEDDTC